MDKSDGDPCQAATLIINNNIIHVQTLNTHFFHLRICCMSCKIEEPGRMLEFNVLLDRLQYSEPIALCKKKLCI